MGEKKSNSQKLQNTHILKNKHQTLAKPKKNITHVK